VSKRSVVALPQATTKNQTRHDDFLLSTKKLRSNKDYILGEKLPSNFSYRRYQTVGNVFCNQDGSHESSCFDTYDNTFDRHLKTVWL